MERQTPIQGQRRDGIPAGQVPESVARIAYSAYTKAYGTSQSFETLMVDRGGLSWSELVACLQGDPKMKKGDPLKILLNGET
jgi:hypothetical protein